MPVNELSLDEIRKLLPSGKLYELSPDAHHILAFDHNAMPFKQARELALGLSKLTGHDVLLVGYDGNVTDNPLNIYEIKKESVDAHAI